MVRERGLEPPRIAPLVPKTSVSTNSTTRAFVDADSVELALLRKARHTPSHLLFPKISKHYKSLYDFREPY